VQEVADVLDRLDELGASQDRVTVEDIQACLGRDAFGPALLTLGLLALSPVGDIPGAATVFAVFIFGVGVQMAAGRATPWLPRALARRSVRGRQLCRAASLFRPVVRVLAVVIRARLTFLTEGVFARAIAATCAILALTLPPLEFVPFGATVPSSVISGFSIALVARDGLLALLSFALMIAGGYFVLTLVG